MNPDIKQEWIAWLRSDDFIQISGKLRNPRDNGRCCLGVLADVLISRGHGKWDGEVFSVDGYPSASELLPAAAALAANISHVLVDGQCGIADLSDEDGNCDVDIPVDYEGYVTGLSALNDRRVSFSEIADIIEAQL